MSTKIMLVLGAVVAALVALWYFSRSGSIGASTGSGMRGSTGVPLEGAQTVPTNASFLRRAGVDPSAITTRTAGFSSATAAGDMRRWMGI